MKDRIKHLMESQHMTQQTFSSFIGISSASLSSILNGRTKPTLNTVEAIREKFPTIRLEWLLEGTGDMFASRGSSDVSSSTLPGSHESESMFDFENVGESVESSGELQINHQDVIRTLKNNPVLTSKIVDKKQRKITEIRIFYDDQTWETFIPQK